MPVSITDHGQRNRVIAPPTVLSEQQGSIVFDGDDNTVVLGEGTLLQGGRIHLGSACSFMCGDDCRLASIEVHGLLRGHVRIGDRTGFTWHSRISLHEPGDVWFGSGCLIAGGTSLSVSDMHSVIDVKTRRRLNVAKDIHLGDRVWLGEGVRVLKGVTIGAGSIVGADAVVTKNIPPNSMAAGVPAKVIRSGVTWRPELIPVENESNVGGQRKAANATIAAVATAVSADAAAAAEQLPPRAEIRSIQGLHRTADGRIISWAQNAEDVMLLRIFGHKKHGTWIDVGANHPSHDSVTRNFYEMGWRGINVEPVEEMYRLLVENRPGDINLCCGVSDHAGEMTFYRDESHLDWSTFDRDAASQYEAGGHMIREIRVPVTTLAEICRRHLRPGQPLDFLKLDVEGHELAVLAGHDFSSWRPTVIVAEVQPEETAEMDALLGGHGYVRRWFDGGNNWYVDSRQEDAMSEVIWRPAYPVMDCYHPWVYAGSFPTTPSSVIATVPSPDHSAASDRHLPARAKGLKGAAVHSIKSALRSMGVSISPRPEHAATKGNPSTVWLLNHCARDPAGFITRIHPLDDVYLNDRNNFQNDELAQASYFRHGHWIMSDLAQVVQWRFGDFQAIGRMLEFPCGHGRLTRFLVDAMPRERVWVSDFDTQAVDFERSCFGVNGFVSSRNPADIDCDERFDLIFVVSLLSHVPRHAFKAMLDKLLSMLTPGGILAFTVHDEIWCPPGMMPADGIAFVPGSGSQDGRSDGGGTTFVTEAFVRNCIAEARGAGWPYARLRRGLCSRQDMYLVSSDASVKYDDLKFRLGPEGCLDRCEVGSGGRLELSGWAGDPDPGHRVTEIQIRLDGHLVQSCQPVIPRPDVVAVLGEPRHATAGWQCLIDVESVAGSQSNRMLEIVVVADDGRTRLLHASRVDAVAGKRIS